jgi:threonine aldolase
MNSIDLRSDTVTLPSTEMRAAMAAAELGDDVYGEDPTVCAFEARAAAVLGKEAAVFVPSGTMGNLLATLSHTRPGDEVICGRFAHTFVAEAAGAARLAGVSTWTVPQERATIDPRDVAAGIHPAEDEHYPRTALIWVEQPNRGWTMPLSHLGAIADVARAHGLPVHMDGARIFNAATALDVAPAEIAGHVDSVMFCISKGLGAPVGSVLVGSAPFIARARRNRKVVGGAMRQAGVLAAAGLYALQHMVDRLADDHRHAARLAEGLRDLGWTIDREHVETNIFFASPPADIPLADVAPRLAEHGVLVNSPYIGEAVRLVTHYGIEAADIERALDIFALLGDRVRVA